MRYLFLFLFSVSLSTHAQTSSQHLYLASKDEVTVFGLHADSGKLTPHQTIPLSGAGPFTFSPRWEKVIRHGQVRRLATDRNF